MRSMSRTRTFPYSGASCATKAISSRAAGEPAGSVPSTVTLPVVGVISPTVRFSSVVLPEPFGPTSAATRPSGIARQQSRSAQFLR